MEQFKENQDLLDSGTVVLSNLCAGGDKHQVGYCIGFFGTNSIDSSLICSVVQKSIAEAGAVRTLVNIILYQNGPFSVIV